MTIKLDFFIFLISSVIITRIEGQDGCRPYHIVTNMRLVGDILIWDEVPYEMCEIGYYIVTIEGTNDNTDLLFQVTETRLDISFLARCEEYKFVVTKVSTDNLTSEIGRFLYAITSPPPEADLTLQYLSLSQKPTWVQVEWGLKEEWKYCITMYRLVIYDEDRDIPEDYYIGSAGVNLTRLTPCTSYTLAVAAMYSIEIEGPPSAIRHRAIEATPPAPSLARLNVGSTSIEMTWEVTDIYVINRCPVTSININAAPYFTISYPVRDDPDNRRPFTVTVPGLTPDTMYNLNVTVTNTGGLSASTSILVQTLESN